MSEPLTDLGWGTGWLLLGSAILANAEGLARLDLSANDKMRLWLRRRLGEDSFWAREIYSLADKKRFRNSKIGFRIVGSLCLVAGFVSLSFFFVSYLR